MCKAFVLRFSCKHGLLMSFELCRIGPCPLLKTTGDRLPQQPYKCYNCQYKLEQSLSRPSKSRGSSSSSHESLESLGSDLSLSPPERASTFPSTTSRVSHPLPGVTNQPSGAVKSAFLCRQSSSKQSTKSFSFACNSSKHFPTPHYANLPTFLPHQDHCCPPCLLEELRQQSDREVIRQAQQEYPLLTEEMLIRDGTIKEWQTKPSLESYVDEKRTEDRELWHHVTRKWTADLTRLKVLVAEEDGLGLLA